MRVGRSVNSRQSNLGSEYDPRPSRENALNLLLGDVHLALTNLFHLFGVGDNHLHPHLQLVFL